MKHSFTVDIEKIVYEGRGMGRVDGKVVFVPFTAPGDRVRVEALREKKDYVEAAPRAVEEASPLRVKPFCDLFGKCGGCQYQHIPYMEQLKLKEEALKDFLQRLNPEGGFELLPVVPSAKDRDYRIRVQFKGGWSGGRNILGFYGLKTHRLVEVKECPLLHPLANEILKNLRKWMEEKRKIFVRNLDLQISPDEDVGVMRFKAEGASNLNMAEAVCKEIPKVQGAVVEGTRKTSWGDLTLSYCWPKIIEQESLRIRVGFGSFSQVNPHQNWNLRQQVVEWAELTSREKVIDLYCGSGNLTLPLGQRAMKVWGVDQDRPAVEMARENARENKLDNCAFFAASAEDGVRRVLKESDSVDVAVLDPPRAGAKKEVFNILPLLHASKILYVSCEPPTLMRDLARLQALGYHLKRIQPLDMFPQTYHIEVVAELIKNRGQGFQGAQRKNRNT